MTLIKKIWLVIFIVIAAAFCVYMVYDYSTTDSTGPVITMDKEKIKVSVSDDEDALLAGVTAVDETDGDVTASLIVDSLSNLYDGNKRQVTYAAFDSAQNVTKEEREIVYTDYTSPHFAQTDSFRFAVGESIDLSELVTAEDCIDGDITSQIIVSDQIGIDYRTAGDYEIEYSVKNSCGDTSYLPVTIEIYEYSSGMMDLELSEYLIYLEKGEEEPDYLTYMTQMSYGTTTYRILDEDTLIDTAQTDADAGEDADGQDDADSDTVIVDTGSSMYDSDVNTKKSGVYTVRLYWQGELYYGEEILTVVVE